MTPPAKFVVITPVRNEAGRIAATIEGMLAQTLQPAQWIVVDDGSSDGTAQIVGEAASSHPWIRLLRRPDRGFRRPGTGVMEAFHDGLREVRDPDWEFLGKLDGDLSFAPDYFERCLERFRADPKLGIGGGVVCSPGAGATIPESRGDPAFHVRGATKIYRRACWEAIGGLIGTTGWDTMDELKANMLGWRTASFPGLNVVQSRKTGGADGVWRNYFKNGRANYIVGYQPLFMAAKCLKRVGERPYGLVALALGCGFVSGYLMGVPRPRERDVVRYLRNQQILALLGRECLWNPRSPDPKAPAG